MTTSIVQHIPNAISIARVFMSGGLAVLLFWPEHPLNWGVALIVTAIISDKLDGSLARALKVESDVGKRIESVADPLFSLVAGLYLLTYFDFPPVYVIFSIILLIVASLFRALYWLQIGNMFYEKSPVTRYGVGIGYVIITMYAFQLPYRFEAFSIAMVYGVIGFFNYCRLIFYAYLRDRT